MVLSGSRKKEMNDEEFRNLIRKSLKEAGVESNDTSSKWCDDFLFFQSIGEGGEEDFRKLKYRIETLEEEHHLTGNRVFYLALPPTAFPSTIENMGKVGLNQSPGWTRVVIEKPFGRDLFSAEELNEAVHKQFKESQIYRIDHYLGKETVQNLLVFRFANAIFESIWNRDRIEFVEITVSEDVGIGNRSGYYTQAGALRDMVQNHLSQLLSLIAMEVPSSFDADSIRMEKVKVLKSILPLQAEDVVFGQYTEGMVNDEQVLGYMDEPGVDSGFDTETYVAMKVDIDNWRWQGVPFYIRTGKRLPRRLTQIIVHFRSAPVCLFQTLDGCEVHANTLIITLQPNEGFDLSFEVKTPTQPIRIKTQNLHFRYDEVFGPLPEAYETLLLDVLTGDQTLFVHSDEVEASWRLYSPLLEEKPKAFEYAAGSWGPAEAEKLLVRDGHSWYYK
jgi:glucose-6-phosphate 1-dehydrogenase